MTTPNPHIPLTRAVVLIGRSTSSLDKLCRAHDVGTLVTRRLRLLTEADIERLKVIVAAIPAQGRPRKSFKNSTN